MSTLAPVGQATATTTRQLLANTQSNNAYAAEIPAAPTSISVSATRTIDPPAGTRIILSIEAAENAGGSDSFMIWRARGMADSVVVAASSSASDSAAYRSRVLALQIMGSRSAAPVVEAEEPVETETPPVEAERLAASAATVTETSGSADASGSGDAGASASGKSAAQETAPVEDIPPPEPEPSVRASSETETAYQSIGRLTSPPTGGSALQQVIA